MPAVETKAPQAGRAGRPDRGARGHARGHRLHPRLDREDGPADQRHPEAVARGPAQPRARTARHDGDGPATSPTASATRPRPPGAEIVVEPLPRFESDRLSIEQVIGNLIDNAVKYLDAVAARPDRGHRARTRRRLGRSIASPTTAAASPTADHERIFELFRRSGRQDRPGEGLGLAFVRNSVRRLGGDIDVESELGKGSTFRPEIPHTPHPAGRRRLRMSNAVKIVMVEDDLGHAKLIEKNIRRANISNEIAPFRRRQLGAGLSVQRGGPRQRADADPAGPEPAGHVAAPTSWPGQERRAPASARRSWS